MAYKIVQPTWKDLDNVNPADKVYTPEHIAKAIIDKFDITGSILDGFAGHNKVFYDQYPSNVEKHWTELELGRNFFDFKEKVDWIITNPAYSIYTQVMKHSMEIADNIVYLVPLSKVVYSMGRIKSVSEYGGVPYIWIIGTGGTCGFPFGFPTCAIHFKRGYKGDTKIEIGGI